VILLLNGSAPLHGKAAPLGLEQPTTPLFPDSDRNEPPACAPLPRTPVPAPPSPLTAAEPNPGLAAVSSPSTPTAPGAVEAVWPSTPGVVPEEPVCLPATPVPVGVSPSTPMPLL